MDGEQTQNDSRLADGPAEEPVRLAAAIESGDRQSEERFVKHYRPRVRAMMLARTRNPDLAEDLVQDVLLEALCALRRGQLREQSKLSAFVLAIARNILNNHFRGAARAAEPLESPDDLPDLRSMSADFESGEREARALEAIERLEATDRVILQMTLVEGLKPGAIAEKLNMSPDVVRQRKLRATRRVTESVTGRSQNSSGLHLVSGRAS
jgi:RNA polymerase sigma factor (sigma-70 family)